MPKAGLRRVSTRRERALDLDLGGNTGVFVTDALELEQALYPLFSQM